ncbi:T9SS type A sorting domain-containing protein [Dyadobacter tibetensis]|uniref:T9SS type A sorting domain-containing protein n=1 Tax=Dyadobacter tibetensis TaxID=1211851 RepID=UPI00046FA632|nr:alpha-amylase family glycosyl hydrolase [Dyadobacter tibetensis]
MRHYLRILVFLLIGSSVWGQQVMIQGFYYDIPKAQCGAAWADTMALKALELAGAGFTHIWTPPFQGNGANSGGYDPRDLYIGDASTVTPLGSKQQIYDMVSSFSGAGMQVVGDMIYNHRDGGAPENNDPVLDYILHKAGNTVAAGYQFSMPSDRYRMVLPVGETAGNGIGNYYINISSRTGTYSGSKYMLYVTTNKIGGSRWSPVIGPDLVAVEQGAALPIQLGRNYEVTIDSDGDNDEFQISLQSDDFNPTDELIIYMININPGDVEAYSNHRPWKIYYDPQGSAGNGAGRDLADAGNVFANGGGFNPNYKLRAQTYTNFCDLPGGGPCMNGSNFRPNWSGNSEADVSQTTLGPKYSQQSMDYFYDYDHQNPDTKQKLIDWTLWSWNEVGIRGLRMDAIKHFPASFVGDLLCAMHAAGQDPSLVVGEWYGQDPGDQGAWLSQVYDKLNACGGAGLNPKVFDFNLRDVLKKATDGGNGVSTAQDCNEPAAWDVRNVFTGSLHDGNGFSGNNVVTMANNHDFRDANPTYGSSLLHHRGNALNSYAYMLTNNHLGVPTIFWPDYYGYNQSVQTWNGVTCEPQTLSYFPVWPEGGLKSQIDEWIDVLKTYIHGSTGIDYLNKFGGPAITYYSGCYKRSLIYQNNASGSVGGKEVLNLVNYSDEAMDVEIPLIMRNGIEAGQVFTRVAGSTSTDTPLVSASGTLRVTVPANSAATWIQGEPLPLPVGLKTFSAKALPHAIVLNWESTTEDNFLGYQLERSVDGKEFVDLAWIEGGNSGRSSRTYHYKDLQAPLGQVLYYRLKMVDRDGKFQFSRIRTAALDPQILRIHLVSNPVESLARIQINNPNEQLLRVQIIDLSGRTILNRVYKQPQGLGELGVDVSAITKGNYLLSVSNGSHRAVERLLIF